jgi:hypothetical protein
MVGVAFGLMYVLAPIVVKFMLTHSAEPSIDVTDPAELGLEEEVVTFLEQTVEALSGEGFALAAHLRHREPKMRAFSIITLLENRRAQEAATAVAMFRQGQNEEETALTCKYVECSTEFEDGTVIDTNNSAELTVFPSLPGRTVLQAPEIREPSRLYRLHTKLVERLECRSKVFKLPEVGPVRHMQEGMTKVMSRMADAGYFRLHERRRLYRATWKGAFFMTWKLVWPVSAIRRALRRRRTAALVKELGV